MSQPSVSIIVPCYQNAATLGAALDSLYRQTRPPDQILVVNDASPETSEIEGVLAEYPGVDYFRNGENLGVGGTRRRGVELARGDIVGFLDADDRYHLRKLEFQLAHLAPTTVSSTRLVRIASFAEPPNLPEYDRITVRRKASIRSLWLRNSLVGPALLAYRDTLLKVGNYDASLRGAEDYDLWLRLLGAGISVVEITQPLYLYFHNPAGLSKNLTDISRWELTVLKKHLAAPGKAPYSSFRSAGILAFWLCKHLRRAAQTGNAELRGNTLEEFGRLGLHYPGLTALATAADRWLNAAQSSRG